MELILSPIMGTSIIVPVIIDIELNLIIFKLQITQHLVKWNYAFTLIYNLALLLAKLNNWV